MKEIIQQLEKIVGAQYVSTAREVVAESIPPLAEN